MLCKYFTFAATLLFFAPPVILTQMATPTPTVTSTPMKIGGDVLPPVLTHSAEPKLPHRLRIANTSAIVKVGLTVDQAGKPTNLHIVKSSDPDFDKISMDAVAKYRFKPAKFHGQPVPVELVVQVDFQGK